MDAALAVLSGRLLIQCRPAQAETLLDVCAAHGAGIVLTGRSATDAVKDLREKGFDRPILCDAERYAGKRRVLAKAGTHPAWCREQRKLGLLPLTDSGYLAARDWTGLRGILLAAARKPSAVATLPLSPWWFGSGPITAALAEEINRHGVPVAVVLEHRSDPFGVHKLLRAFLRFLADCAPPVLVLRCDISAVGLLCHGAHAAAVGTRSSLRHLYPASGGHPGGTSVFVPRLLSYHRLETCAKVFERTPEIEQLWTCPCPVCEDQAPSGLDRSSAVRHDLDRQLALRDELFRRRLTAEQRRSSWHETCSHAGYVHRQVAEVVRGWKEPANLRAWYRVTEDPLPRTIPGQPTSGTARPRTGTSGTGRRADEHGARRSDT
ncbi:hypothetical protein ATK30_7856 [Amycolatopsis echigonensis]|uniref:tRNA-guanine family transglycosylase n=1 Tax=Amycolatopsis echigonensis TaxID=2576905 RepID=A0A2N3WSN3_9PSEU|nr:hypothetical protein [Amycolatopsis niigatensis]PKV96891.1 hypothetical protein ATK30_7856 [Amycolatopsis niigatensis]